ncbi:MAG: nucleotidyltransferase family protein [Coriobacteriia bacterium]
MTESEAIVARIEESADEIRTRFGVSRLGVFGSRVRGDESRDSDLDVLVEFACPTFRNYMGLKRYLEELSGVAVDLVSASALKPLLKSYVMSEVRYVA